MAESDGAAEVGRLRGVLTKMAAPGCRCERMGFPHCGDVYSDPEMWCEPCQAVRALRGGDGERA